MPQKPVSSPFVAGTIRLPAPDAPVASVVVLAFRRVDVLARCLSALAAHRSAYPFEVVVVVNGATPEVRAFVAQRVEGGVVVHAQVNLGFAGGCNRGVAASSGRYLVLLNDDAVVEDGWLDALVSAAEDDPAVGALGSLVLDPDGAVQDLGGHLEPDGMPVVDGRGLARTSPLATTRRPIDYASGCAVLVRRSAWDEVGGMDERFYPAYFEDVDLCLRLRAAGWEVWFEPGAVVRHDESASTDPVLKSLAWDWNKARFLARWGPAGEPTTTVPDAPTATGLLQDEVRFLERAAEVHEERLARTTRLLEEARFELGRLRIDHLGALEALEHERSHTAWLRERLDDERTRAAAAEAEVQGILASPSYRQVLRAQGLLGRSRVLRRIARGARGSARRLRRR